MLLCMSSVESGKDVVLKTTSDGSLTLYVPGLDEHYHSMNGAVQESRHVYLEAGLNQYIHTRYSQYKEAQPEIHVLEFGFGTGLNTLLTALEAEKQRIRIRYSALEKYPLSQEITDQLNYSKADRSLFRLIHQCEWERPVMLSSYFILRKMAIDFAAFDFPDRYDVVYFDAFAPDKQPDVWSPELFTKLFSSMNMGGILTTYCAKGSIRRMMQHAGFSVERIPGAPGKREMLRAHVLSDTDSDKAEQEYQQ